ncbi:MAG TPA: hypothetical protein VMB72_11385 [Acidimicrobiales bacterium]|nr:hypothetical protein [Acidimicrobiales bacterium]
MTRRTKVLAAAAVVVAAAGVSGGGLASGAFARSRPVVQDSASSAPVTSASFSFTLSLTGLTRHGTVAVSGTGQVDFADDAVSAAVTLPASVASLIPGGSDSPTTIDAVLSGGTVYAEIPGLATLVGEPWISVALPSSVTSGIPAGFSTVAGALGDVNEILTFARSHHAKVVSLGSGTVGTTPASVFGIGGRLDGIRLGAKLWADGSGRLVQASVQAAGHGFSVSGTVDLTDYGAPVTITAPAPSQTRAIPLSLVESVLGKLLHNGHLGRFLAKAA